MLATAASAGVIRSGWGRGRRLIKRSRAWRLPTPTRTTSITSGPQRPWLPAKCRLWPAP